MKSLRVIEDGMTTKIEDMPECIIEIWHKIKTALQEIDASAALRNRSESLKPLVAEKLAKIDNASWEKKTIFRNPELADAAAIYRLDGYAECDKECKSLHLVNIVLCLNNRESIGTNFLKLELAAKEDLRNSKIPEIYNENILGLLISLDEGMLEAGKWDSSYASASEYTFAYKHAYRNMFDSNIVNMQLHLIN